MKTTRGQFLAGLGLMAGSATPGTAQQKTSSPPAAAPKPTGADLGSLYPEALKLAEPVRYEYSFADGHLSNFDLFQRTARATIFDLLQYRPAKTDARPEVIEQTDMGDYIREKVLFSTTPAFRVPAYVLIPKKRTGKLPAIVDLHSHGGMFIFGKEKVIDMGSNHPAMTEYHLENYDGRPTATQLVKQGYVVITIDAFGFGERRIILDEDLKYGLDRSKYSLSDVKRLNDRSRKESTIVKDLALAGKTWPGVVFWDDIRTVDYLVTRPEVDPKRIGCMGISMGGYRSLFLAALDTRIQAACVAGFMSTVHPMMKSHVDTHSFIHFLPGLHRYLDWPDVASLTAPRHLAVLQCRKDGLFPLKGMEDSLQKIGTAYQKAGIKDHFLGKFYDVPHRFTKQMQDDAFAWMNRLLQK